MLRTALNPHHWCVVRTVGREPGERSEGAAGLLTALQLATRMIDDYGARRIVIFDGQPSDGAKVVASIDLDGSANATAAPEPYPSDAGAFRALLVLRDAAATLDARLADGEIPPTGDDYNHLLAAVAVACAAVRLQGL